MTPASTPGDKLRAYAAARGWPQGDLDYLLGVLGEAVLVERGRVAKIVRLYLVFDSQRAVSWQEVQDCLAAIRKES